uniref:NADH dehydrogenase subunit 6 n=1 Tax=Trichomalopsis sarcophagae TaxID=543379 RepID=UPI002182012C|nr:NADH dehydrogenase subunit 6 [Trichomalopsis sarcophagae]UVN15283.1 NADH dehydrogenase subunit 6 [Trichomalopsis sarcophagae]
MMKTLITIQIYFIMMMIFISLIILSLPSYNKNIHPLIICLMLLIYTISNSMNISLLNYTHWFSYIMYLIMIGGMMIIFLYFTSFINNMKMKINWTMLISFPIKLMTLIMFIIVMVKTMNIILPWNNYVIELINNNSINNNINYMFIYNKNISMIISMLYLFLCLTMIVKITINKKMTLRKIN